MRDGADGLFRDAPRGRAFPAASPEQAVIELNQAIRDYLDGHNADPKPVGPLLPTPS